MYTEVEEVEGSVEWKGLRCGKDVEPRHRWIKNGDTEMGTEVSSCD